MWFTDIAKVENPGQTELIEFTRGVEAFLGFVLEDGAEFGFLWEGHAGLRELAQDTYNNDVRAEAGRMRDVIGKIPSDLLDQHGLRRRPLKFKLRVLDSIANAWERIRDQFLRGDIRRFLSIREWLKKIVDAIDAVLDSLIAAAAGAGGLIKEFKDALRALA
jgi:hypothetical protein